VHEGGRLGEHALRRLTHTHTLRIVPTHTHTHMHCSFYLLSSLPPLSSLPHTQHTHTCSHTLNTFSACTDSEAPCTQRLAPRTRAHTTHTHATGALHLVHCHRHQHLTHPLARSHQTVWLPPSTSDSTCPPPTATTPAHYALTSALFTSEATTHPHTHTLSSHLDMMVMLLAHCHAHHMVMIMNALSPTGSVDH